MEDEALKYIKAAETDFSSHYYQRSDNYKKAFEIYKLKSDKNKSEEMRFESEAFDLRLLELHFEKAKDDFGSQAFGSMYSLKDKTGNFHIYPNIKNFNDSQYDYYKKRLQDTSNYFNKARYADILWDQKKEYKAAIIAIEEYLKIGNRMIDIFKTALEEHGHAIEACTALTRALKISSNLSDAKKIQVVYDCDLKILEELKIICKPRWFIEIIESIFKVNNIASIIDLKKILPYIEYGIDYFDKEKNFHILRSFFNLKAQITQLLSSDNNKEEIQKMIIETGNSYIKEGDARLSDGPMKSNLAAAHFYQKALDYFLSKGITDKKEDLLNKIKACYTEAEKNEFQRIESTVKIDMKFVDDHLEPLLKLPLNDILIFIGLDPSLRPNYLKAAEKAKDDASKYVFLNILDKVVIRNGNPAVTLGGDIGRSEAQTIENFIFDYKFLAVYLDMIFQRLRDKVGLNKENLRDYFSNALFLKHDIKTIEIALERYFANDYVSFLSIVVPRIENILRKFLEVLNIPTNSARPGIGIQEINLDSLLDNENLLKILGEDIIFFLKYFLTEKAGTNLRHDISHGLLDFEGFNKMNSNLIIYIWLILATYIIKSS